MIRYKVIIPCYQHTDRGSGHINIEKYIYDEEEAFDFAYKCDNLIIKDRYEFHEWVEDNIVSDGYITGESDIYKQEINEERIK